MRAVINNYAFICGCFVSWFGNFVDEGVGSGNATYVASLRQAGEFTERTFFPLCTVRALDVLAEFLYLTFAGIHNYVHPLVKNVVMSITDDGCCLSCSAS